MRFRSSGTKNDESNPLRQRCMGGATPVICWWTALLILSSLSGCSVRKFLDVDEYLLTQNSIKLQTEEKIDNKRRLKYELSTLYEQEVNGNFFFIPREWFYFKTQDVQDTTQFDNWQRRVIAEPPTLFDEEKSGETADAMRRFLRYKGYYDAEVFFDETVKARKKKVEVTYFVRPGRRYLVDTIYFSSADSNVARILDQIAPQTVFQKGVGLDGQLYEQEKRRISDYLRNHGYADFYPNAFPPMEVDTTNQAHRATLFFEVSPPVRDSVHPIFYVGDLHVYPDFDITVPEDSLRDTLIQGVHFHLPAGPMTVRPKTILDNIFFQQGELYRQEAFDRTNRQLGELSVFRFVRIKQQADPRRPDLLHFRIELAPNPLLKLGVDVELNYTNRSNNSGIGNLIGVSISPSISNRNLLGGSELLVSNLSAGVEINPNLAEDRFWNTIDLRLQSDLYLPRFSDYLGIWKTLHALPFGKKRKRAGDSFYDRLQARASTRLSASYNYVLLLDFYEYNLFAASYGYNLQPDQRNRYILNHLALDYFQPTVRPAFQELLDANPFLERSFGNQLFISLLFREFNYTYNEPSDALGRSSFFNVNVETAGFEPWLGNTIYNAFALNTDTLRIGQTDFSQYVRLETDYRYYKNYSPTTSLAARFNFGIARPFGYSSDVPYVKQFYGGGPNDIRGWAARELGPGGHIDSLTLNTNNPLLFYQAGDLKLQMNLEYRFNIYWRLNGAFFLDMGNIWTVRPDPSRPGSQFRFREGTFTSSEGQEYQLDPFYRQIAVSSGFGLRFDFTYFIFRLDLGLKLRYPYQWREGKYWNDLDRLFQDTNLNFGLGFPF